MSHDPAVARFVLLQVVRLIGALIALTGAVILSHGQPALAHVPDLVGYAALAGGAAAFFFIPYALSKHWKRQT